MRLSLYDLLAVVQEFIHPQMSRSALDGLLRRRGESRLPEPDKPAAHSQPFKAYKPGFVHVALTYLPQLAHDDSRCYVFVAIDRATRWVFISIAEARTAAAARRFPNALASKALFKIKTVLTDNGTEFSDRLFGSRAKEPSGEHEFDRLCESLDIDHRLTRVCRPQTNGMVERSNGRIEQILQTHQFNSAEDLHATTHRYVRLYNEHLPQKALKHAAPVEALRNWQKTHPDLFIKQVRIHPGPGT